MSSPFDGIPLIGPEEIMALAQRQDLHAMHDHERKLRIAEFIRGLKPEDMATLGDLLTMIASFGDSKAGALYHLGIVHEAMRSIHKVCVCGKDHDAEALAAEEARLKMERDSVEEKRVREMYDKYHMEADPGRDGGIRCAKCKLPYSTLSDRMLRSPDDCHGCKERSAWG